MAELTAPSVLPRYRSKCVFPRGWFLGVSGSVLVCRLSSVMSYPALQTFFRTECGKWLPLPEDARKTLFELFRKDPFATFFRVLFPGDGAMLEYRCWREHPERSRVFDVIKDEPHPSLCLTHFWSVATHGVYEHYDTQMACQLEYTYRQLEDRKLASPAIVGSASSSEYQIHVKVEEQMTEFHLPTGATRDVLRTKIPVGPPPRVTHYKDGVLTPTAPPPFFYQNKLQQQQQQLQQQQQQLQQLQQQQQQQQQQPPTEPHAKGPPTQPDAANSVAVPSAVSGAVVGYVDELTIYTRDDKVVQATFSIVDKAGNTLKKVQLLGNGCVEITGDLNVTIATEQLIYDHVQGLVNVMSGVWNSRRLLQFLTENCGKLLMLALVVAGVGCVVASWIGVSLGVIVLILIFAWWWGESSSTVKQAAVILNVPTSSMPREVRDATLTKVQTLSNDSADPVKVWRAHALLNALYVFETAHNVLPYCLCP
jgi:type II secretory pathway pseudopilin PulG